MSEPEMMTCDWCGKEFPADARACCEAGFDALYQPEKGEEWKGEEVVAGMSPEDFSPVQREKMKQAMGLDDGQLEELLRTGKVGGLGAIICLECQDSGEVDSQ